MEQREKADLMLVDRIPAIEAEYGQGRDESFYFGLIANDLQCELNAANQELAERDKAIAEARSVITSIARGNNDRCCMEDYCSCPSCIAGDYLERNPERTQA